MSNIVVSAPSRQNVVSSHATGQSPDEGSNDMADHLADRLPPGPPGCPTGSRLIAIAWATRRLIAISPFALAGQAQPSVLHLLR